MPKFSKKAFFYFILFVLPIFLLFLFEMGLRFLQLGYDLSLFRISKSNPEYFEINPQVTRRYFFNSPGTEPYPEMFLRVKPDSCFRIFVLGESSAQGFPYRRNGSFPCMLHNMLQKSYPNRRIEVINVSMAAINSYALADFIDEIIDKQPDLIIIYAGHNEFYGALGVASTELGSVPRFVKIIHLYLVKLRLYQAMQKVVRSCFNISGHGQGTLMNRIAQKSSIEYKSLQYHQGLRQFEKNMTHLLSKTKARNIPVILSTVVSNVKDLPPLCSDSVSDSAYEVYKNAQRMVNEANYAEVKRLYYLAKDLDVVRFRAPEDINALIVKLANQFEYPLVDIKSVFEANSPHQLIGDNLIIDHLHPNTEGYSLMAYTFYHYIIHSIYKPAKADSTLSYEHFKQSYAISSFDSAYATFSVKVLKSDWPFTNRGKNRFINTYKPHSYLDSLVVQTYLNLLPVEQAQYQFALHQMLLGNSASAIEEFKSLILKFPYHAAFYIYLANLYEKNEQISAALHTLLSFPDMYNNAEILENTIRLQIRLDDHQRAMSNIQRIEKLKLSPEIAQRINMYKKSIHRPYGKTIVRSIIVEPRAKQYLDEASHLITVKNYDAALLVLQRSLLVQETYIAHFFIGSILLRKGKYSEALAELEQAYRYEKNDPQLLHNLIVVYIKLKKYKEAEQVFSHYKEINTSDSGKIKKLELLLHQQTP